MSAPKRIWSAGRASLIERSESQIFSIARRASNPSRKADQARLSAGPEFYLKRPFQNAANQTEHGCRSVNRIGNLRSLRAHDLILWFRSMRSLLLRIANGAKRRTPRLRYSLDLLRISPPRFRAVLTSMASPRCDNLSQIAPQPASVVLPRHSTGLLRGC